MDEHGPDMTHLSISLYKHGGFPTSMMSSIAKYYDTVHGINVFLSAPSTVVQHIHINPLMCDPHPHQPSPDRAGRSAESMVVCMVRAGQSKLQDWSPTSSLEDNPHGP